MLIPPGPITLIAIRSESSTKYWELLYRIARKICKNQIWHEVPVSGWNALHTAAFCGHIVYVRELLAKAEHIQSPFDLACKTIDGHTASDLARQQGHDGMWAFLRSVQLQMDPSKQIHLGDIVILSGLCSSHDGDALPQAH